MFNFSEETLGIIGVTLKMSLASTIISTVIGTVLGLLLEKNNFPGKRIVVRICRTLMGTPPVVAGLAVYLLLMRRGPLGFMGILFTVQAMVIAGDSYHPYNYRPGLYLRCPLRSGNTGVCKNHGG